MIDLIFPVENTHEWHKANLENNANDYSKYARKHGLEIIDALQETCAKIYYHPYVPFEGQTIKYGVISVDDMIRDLNERSHLYVAGRAHKPMATILENEKIDEAMRNNRNSAVNTALLFLPEEFSKMDLYMKIANLSYMGDSRKMLRGEPKDKVGRIVKGSREGFENIYAPIINSKKDILQALNGDKIQQTFEPRETANLYYSLPSHLREVA
ncbi:hypothetical protein KBC03_01935 [Patescibacteria group bacterium]|nr:hypothetical protein [Patescibacteria group bacterium]